MRPLPLIVVASLVLCGCRAGAPGVRSESLTMPRTWLVVGSAPGVEAYHAALRPLLPHLTSITANAGGTLWTPPSRPDFYWLSDAIALDRYRALAFAMRSRGTRIICPERHPAKGSSLDWAPDISIRYADPNKPMFRYSPGVWVHPGLSGLICLQFALHSGASRVILAGMTGYDGQRYFDGRVGPTQATLITKDAIQPFTQSAIDALPGVEFIMCGRPAYTLTGRNVVICTDPAQVLRYVPAEATA